VDLLSVTKPWTYWLALPLTLMSVLALLAVLFGYLRKTVGAKYPDRD
jgi:hypothetical protein